MTKESYLHQLDKDNIHLTTRPYLNKVEKHTDPYTVDVFGKSITVFPGVMSPAYDWAGLYMIDCLPERLHGKDILELGVGSGLVSVFAGLKNARSISCGDINPIAVENTKYNLNKFNLSSDCLISDVYSAFIGKKYDVIIFNLPYHNSVPKSDLEKGVIDENYHAMLTLFRDSKKYLRADGTLFVGFSQSGDEDLLKKAIQESGFIISEFRERNTYEKVPRFIGPDFHYNCQVYELSIPKNK